LVGRRVEVDALVAEVMADADFFAGTGGGVTFSGGEPLAQAPFLFACARLLRSRGLHVAVETSGTWPASLREALCDCVDLVLFDLKHVDPVRLRAEVGPGGPRALSNLRALLEANVAVQVRLTLVPGFNDGDEDLAAIARWIAECPGARPVHLQPFHRMATAKQTLYDRPYAWADAEPPPASRLAEARRWFG
jgi:pyruvate formate lyase activating enzyme